MLRSELNCLSLCMKQVQSLASQLLQFTWSFYYPKREFVQQTSESSNGPTITVKDHVHSKQGSTLSSNKQENSLQPFKYYQRYIMKNKEDQKPTKIVDIPKMVRLNNEKDDYIKSLVQTVACSKLLMQEMKRLTKSATAIANRKKSQTKSNASNSFCNPAKLPTKYAEKYKTIYKDKKKKHINSLELSEHSSDSKADIKQITGMIFAKRKFDKIKSNDINIISNNSSQMNENQGQIKWNKINTDITSPTTDEKVNTDMEKNVDKHSKRVNSDIDLFTYIPSKTKHNSVKVHPLPSKTKFQNRTKFNYTTKYSTTKENKGQQSNFGNYFLEPQFRDKPIKMTDSVHAYFESRSNIQNLENSGNQISDPFLVGEDTRSIKEQILTNETQRLPDKQSIPEKAQYTHKLSNVEKQSLKNLQTEEINKVKGMPSPPQHKTEDNVYLDYFMVDHINMNDSVIKQNTNLDDTYVKFMNINTNIKPSTTNFKNTLKPTKTNKVDIKDSSVDNVLNHFMTKSNSVKFNDTLKSRTTIPDNQEHLNLLFSYTELPKQKIHKNTLESSTKKTRKKSDLKTTLSKRYFNLQTSKKITTPISSYEKKYKSIYSIAGNDYKSFKEKQLKKRPMNSIDALSSPLQSDKYYGNLENIHNNSAARMYDNYSNIKEMQPNNYPIFSESYEYKIPSYPQNSYNDQDTVQFMKL